MAKSESTRAIREVVRRRYAEAAKAVTTANGSGACCGGDGAASCCGDSSAQAITSNLYTAAETANLPEAAVLASLGCGNPTALAELRPGEVVLDLGSGGGIDVLLSARRVGPNGFAYGLDMTDEMIALARDNVAKAGVTNVAFLKGHIEEIPLPDATVDVVISNCVINLSADKDAVLREAFRVLKPGGRFAVSDIVVRGRPLGAAMRRSLALWAGCVAGALTEDEYRRKLAAAGFEQVEVEVTREYGPNAILGEGCCDATQLTLLGKRRIVSAFVRATKPS